MPPQPVHHVPAELLVLRVRHPRRQRLAHILPRLKRQLTPVQRLRRPVLLRPRLLHGRGPGCQFLQSPLGLRDALLRLLPLLRSLLQLLPLFPLRRRLRLVQLLAGILELLLLLRLLPARQHQLRRPLLRRFALQRHLRKERREPVIIILRVFLQRVVVALGAPDPRPQERLRHRVGRLRILHLRLLSHRHHDAPARRRRRRVPARGQRAPRQRIPPPVRRRRPPQPRLKLPHALGPAHVVVALLAVL